MQILTFKKLISNTLFGSKEKAPRNDRFGVIFLVITKLIYFMGQLVFFFSFIYRYIHTGAKDCLYTHQQWGHSSGLI